MSLARRHRIGAQAQQHIGDGDPHWADLLAGPAERAGLGQHMLVGQVGLEQRGQDRADRAGVDPAIGVAADRLINWAGIQAGPAANTHQRFGILAAHNLRAAIVEQHQVELLGAVALARAGRAADDTGVDAELLAGGRAGQHLQHHAEIIHRLDDSLDAHHRHMDTRHAGGQAGVALILDDRDRAAGRHAKVHPADAHIGLQKALAQSHPRSRGHSRDVVGLGHAQVFVEQIAHLLAGLVNRGGDNVRGRLTGQLNNVLAQVGLNNLKAAVLKSLVKMDLLRGHRLRLDDCLYPTGLGQFGDIALGLRAILGPADLAAAPLDILGQLG